MPIAYNPDWCDSTSIKAQWEKPKGNCSESEYLSKFATEFPVEQFNVLIFIFFIWMYGLRYLKLYNFLKRSQKWTFMPTYEWAIMK